MMEKAREVKELRLQVPFPIVINEKKICDYIADFVYDEKDKNGEWLRIIEDAKGMKTDVYRLKKKMVEATYGIQIRETYRSVDARAYKKN
jgi:hypothetical protein